MSVATERLWENGIIGHTGVLGTNEELIVGHLMA